MFKLIHKLYKWSHDLAKSPSAPYALFLLSFAEASFFPIPPDILLIALSLGFIRKSFYFALICCIGSVLGGISGYFIGQYIWLNGDAYTAFAEFFFNHIPGFSKNIFIKIQDQYNQHGFLIIFTAGFTPIPYKIFTITAGAFNISFPLFIIASTVSRAARFFLIAMLIFKFGHKIRDVINRYFNLISIILTILLIGGYILIHYIFIN